jgi:hypothetical protein
MPFLTDRSKSLVINKMLLTKSLKQSAGNGQINVSKP